MPEVLFVSQVDDPEPWRRTLAEIAPDITFRVWPDDPGDPALIDCALVWNPPAGFLATLPNLRLIQSLGAGVDGLLGDPDLPARVPIARLVDPLLTQGMVEYVVLHVLYHHRLMPMFARQQAARVWREEIAPPARERTIAILGLGEMGREAARALAALGFAVRGWSRTTRTIAGVACYSGADGLAAMLGEADMLVCLLPLTAETENILDADLFAMMPMGAALISCGRGRQLVEPDLLDALDSGRVAGASLDVFRAEPLPADHPFWSRPELVITPHLASMCNPASAGPQLVENIARAFAGRPPLHQVDPARGY